MLTDVVQGIRRPPLRDEREKRREEPEVAYLSGDLGWIHAQCPGGAEGM